MKEKSFEPGRDNIVLIGMPGAGKSTLGIVLAKILCMDFVDADLLIQQSCDKSLQRLIDTLGPDAFLEIENQVLSEMSFDHSVIATGGSAIYSEPAMDHLSDIGRVVYLKISFDELTAMALNGMLLVQMAVNNAVGEVGIHFITFAIFAFAFSSLIGNYFYAETNFRYIFKNTKWGMLVFRILCLAAIFYGCVNSFDLAWNLADIFMGFMAIINLVAILLLGKWALAALDDYTRQRKEGKDPVFIAASVPGMPACECWTTADLPNFGDNPVEEYIEEAASLDSEGLR